MQEALRGARPQAHGGGVTPAPRLERAMQGRGRSGSSVVVRLQLRASLSMGNLAQKLVESLAWQKRVDAAPYASGNVSFPKANAELFPSCVWKTAAPSRSTSRRGCLAVGAVAGGEAGRGHGRGSGWGHALA